ncbi:hypothetical protein ACFXPR_06580 [Nocardia tengchongensis]|uniref:hypothetical protein n=1 Tax=Nocardia tengchongensis TaxID=2055889 RepID=UPI0036986939
MVSGNDESADRQAAPGQPETEFGPSLNDFGPSLNDFGPTPVAEGPGWSPAPAPQSPDLAWRPAGAPQYPVQDAWQPATGQFPAVNGPATGQFPAPAAPSAPDVEETVKIPPGGPQSAAGDVEQTTRITGTDSVAAERHSAPAETEASADSWWRSTSGGFPPAPPAESAAPQEESLSWADDPIAKALAPKNLAPQRERERERDPESAPPWRRIGLIAGAVVAVLAVAGGVTYALTRGGTDDTPTAGVTTGKPSPTVAALSCPAKHDGKLTIGNGPGGTGSGVDAILGFQYAFYVDRSGAKARSFVVPDATTVAPAEVMQTKGIDQLKPGTTYCLKVVETGPESYDVDITEHRVDGTTEVYVEHIVTAVRDGKHLIQSIE